MASFSASDAALTGFRIVRERPRTLMVWIAVQFVVQAVLVLGMVQVAGPAMTQLSAASVGSTRDPAQTAAIVGQLGPFYLLIALFSLIFYPILYSTMNRAVLSPGEEGFGYIRFGADELRQIGLLLLVFGIGIVAYIALIFVLVVAGIVAAVATGSGHGGPSAMILTGLVAVLVGLAILAAWIYVWVRLSLASPLTFATRKINLFGSWRLTRGLFWPMLGAYVVAFILAMIAMLLTTVISLAVSGVLGGGVAGLQAVLRPDMSSIPAYLTPARLVSLAISAVSSALVWPVLLTPAAAIYRSLPEAVEAPNVAAAFD
jgi:hypothetical protein